MKVLAAVLLAAALAAAPVDPVAWRAMPPGPVKPGARFTVKLVAKIEPGWHLYSMKPLPDGPIPTRIWIPEGQAAQLAAAIHASDPQTLQDPSFGMEVELYEGDASFVLPLRVAAAAPAGAQKLVVNTSYQSCDNKICLPPKTVSVEVPLTISR